jgi:hypothetical protein
MSGYREQSDIGSYKVDALRDIVQEKSGTSITVHRAPYEGQPLTTPAVISCVDLMGNKDEAPLRGRRLIWSKVRKNPRVEIFLDTRTAGPYIEVYAVDPTLSSDIRRYEIVLFDDNQGTEHVCGTHGILYGSMFAAAAVAANLTTFWTNGKKKWRFAFRCDTLQAV